MATGIVRFDKSLERRHQEFRDILGSEEHFLPASRVFDEWRSYAEQVVEPLGWESLWKLTRTDCERFSVSFPTIVFVEVLDVNFRELTATTNTVAVQEHFGLPEINQVPLQQLFLTMNQVHDQLNTDRTAEFLDQYRFFCGHLWYPWDKDADDLHNWLEKLESRMQLNLDLCSGMVHRETGSHICALLQEGKNIESQIDRLAKEQDLDDADSSIESIDQDVAGRLMELELRKAQIKVEVEMLENPAMRKLLDQRKRAKAHGNRNGDGKEFCTVWLGGTIDQFMEFLTESRKSIDTAGSVKCLPSAQDALDQAMTGDTLLLCSGDHGLLSRGFLDQAVSVVGVGNSKVIALRSSERINTLLDVSVSGGIVKLENLTVDACGVQTALVSRAGTLHLINCRVVGDSENVTSQGVLVLKGGILVAEDCHFTGLGTGVVGVDGSEVTLTNCKLDECGVGLQVTDESVLKLHSCSIERCGRYGLTVEVDDEARDQTQLSMQELLDEYPTVKVQDTVIESNAKGDVIIRSNTLSNLVEESEDSDD